jgi:hypothetical protein
MATVQAPVDPNAPIIPASPRIVIKSQLHLPIVTEHFIIRSYQASDIVKYTKFLRETLKANERYVSDEVASLRTQIDRPEYVGRINLAVEVKKPPKKEDGTDDERTFLSDIELKFTPTWPVLTCIRNTNIEESTELIKAFMEFWWSLPENPNHRVPCSVSQPHPHYSREELVIAQTMDVKDEKAFKAAGFHVIWTGPLGNINQTWLARTTIHIEHPDKDRLWRWGQQLMHLT